MGINAQKVSLAGPAGVLEALIERPEQVCQSWAAVICHPHPQHHGTMHNKVVHTLSRSFTDLGIPALRFNYRGVGGSAGEYDNGVGETLDAAAAVEFMQKQLPDAGILLAGFSFGAGVAIRQSLVSEPDLLVTVAPPVGRAKLPEVAAITCPWLVVHGSADELVSETQVQRWVRDQKPAPHFELMPGVSHYFHGHLTRLRRGVAKFVETHLELSGNTTQAQ